MSTRKKCALTCIIITGFLLVSFSQALAETMKFRLVYFHTQVEVVEIPDVQGHKIYAGGSTGLATLTTGEVAVGTLKWVADYINGAGPVPIGYIRLTFEDGSTIDYKGVVHTRPDPNGYGSLFERGTGEIYQGSGRYTGIRGTLTSSGRRFAPLGEKAQCYIDYTLTYTLP
jgi:hypothetical protein